jgi:hypothetical protein
MKSIKISLYALVAVALLSFPAFAANQNLQNPTLIDSEGAGAFTSNRSVDEHYGIAPAWDTRRSVQVDRMQNPTLIDSEGAGAFTSNRSGDEHYGIAPAWEGRSPNSADLRLVNPTLQNIYDNVE